MRSALAKPLAHASQPGTLPLYCMVGAAGGFGGVAVVVVAATIGLSSDPESLDPPSSIVSPTLRAPLPLATAALMAFGTSGSSCGACGSSWATIWSIECLAGRSGGSTGSGACFSPSVGCTAVFSRPGPGSCLSGEEPRSEDGFVEDGGVGVFSFASSSESEFSMSVVSSARAAIIHRRGSAEIWGDDWGQRTSAHARTQGKWGREP